MSKKVLILSASPRKGGNSDTLNAQMKTLIDRTFDSLRGFTDCLENPHEKGVIAATGVWQKGEVNGLPYMKQAYEMGKAV